MRFSIAVCVAIIFSTLVASDAKAQFVAPVTNAVGAGIQVDEELGAIYTALYALPFSFGPVGFEIHGRFGYLEEPSSLPDFPFETELYGGAALASVRYNVIADLDLVGLGGLNYSETYFSAARDIPVGDPVGSVTRYRTTETIEWNAVIGLAAEYPLGPVAIRAQYLSTGSFEGDSALDVLLMFRF